MEKKDTGQMLRAFRKDFELTLAETALIVKPMTPGFEKRVRRMDRVRKEMKDVVKPEALRKWLFAYNENLGESYFDAMVNGRFDSVINNIIAFKQGVFD